MSVHVENVNGVDYTFDFDDSRIDIPANQDKLTADLWTAIKLAAASLIGVAYPPIAAGDGLNTLESVDNIKTFLTVTLFGTWEVNSLKSSGKFTVQGFNLIRDDNNDPFRDNPLVTYIAFFSQAGTVATVSTGSGLSPEQDLTLTAAKQAAEAAEAASETNTSLIGSLPSASEIATSVWNFVIETGFPAIKIMRAKASALFGKVVKNGTTQEFKRASDDNTTAFESTPTTTEGERDINIPSGGLD